MTDVSALEAKEKARGLMDIEGVIGIGISTGSGNIVNVYVRQMTPEIREKIPPQVDGTPTRTIEVGEVRALQRTDKMRPARPGISIGHVGITAGTHGCLVTDNVTGGIGMLSNAHVFTDYPPAETMDDYTILQPGVADGGTTADRIGQTERWIPIIPTSEPGTNIVDCALCLPDSEADISGDILGIGIPTGTQSAYQDMQVIKSGRTTAITEGTVLDVNADIQVEYNDFSANFTDQIITTPMASGGDSGSVLLNKANNRIVGLLFAGSGSITIHNKIHNVMDNLSVTVSGAHANGPVQANLGWVMLLSLIVTGAYYLYRGGWD